MVDAPKLYTISHVAKYFGVSPNAVRKWESRPDWPVIPLRTEDGGLRLYTPEMIVAIDRWRLKGGCGDKAA